jgi:magnesium transporter
MAEAKDAKGGSGRGLSSLSHRLASRSGRISLEALRFLGASHRRTRVAPPPGAPAGTLAVPVHAVETRIRSICYDAESVDERSIESLEELSELAEAEGRVTWIDMQGFANRDALERIGQVFGIHPLALADVVHVPQRPKAEMHDGRLLIVTQMALLTEAGEIEVEQVSLVLGPGWVVTFQERQGDVFQPVRERVRSAAARIRRMGADFLAYALLDAVIDGYFPVVEAIGGILEQLEEEVVAGPGAAALARIHATRRTLLHLHRVQWRQRDAVHTLLRDESFPFSEPVRIYLRDAHDHAFQTLDAIETYRDMAVGLMDVYLSSTSHRMNEAMRTLTVMASVFIPLTFVVGVYGMNFERMPELHWQWGYPAVWGVILAIGFGLRRRSEAERRWSRSRCTSWQTDSDESPGNHPSRCRSVPPFLEAAGSRGWAPELDLRGTQTASAG